MAELASLPAVASHEPMFAGSVVLNKITILFKVIFSLNDSASLLWMVETWVDGFLFIILKITVHKSLVIYSVWLGKYSNTFQPKQCVCGRTVKCTCLRRVKLRFFFTTIQKRFCSCLPRKRLQQVIHTSGEEFYKQLRATAAYCIEQQLLNSLLINFPASSRCGRDQSQALWLAAQYLKPSPATTHHLIPLPFMLLWSQFHSFPGSGRKRGWINAKYKFSPISSTLSWRKWLVAFGFLMSKFSLFKK